MKKEKFALPRRGSRVRIPSRALEGSVFTGPFLCCAAEGKAGALTGFLHFSVVYFYSFRYAIDRLFL